MNKTELVNLMAEKAGLTKKDTELALKAFIESVEEALKEGKKIQLIGFGTFETRERAERKGRNPRTKEEITIPASLVPAFKTSGKFKEIIKEQFNK
ncbi:HU family DNA-binding protein [Clostridium botulinum C]|uniref:HU family DNA-binding protein n=1 Tax=Clostridium botulinum TaxID=1491 RepID=UPI001E3D5152|nr:HU family DNA-binding protein [Clostridium botulinum]MCD3217332.1 HU family DNA-binding protein [Clostridium botulinum C]